MGKQVLQPSSGVQRIKSNGYFREYHHAKHCYLPTSLPCFLYWAWCNIVWNTSVVSLGHLSWLCLLPASHVPPTSLTSLAVQKAEKTLDLCKPCSTIKTSLHYQLCDQHKPEHSPIPDTRKKINSPSAKTSTEVVSSTKQYWQQSAWELTVVRSLCFSL